ncbi:MAG: hypothetical protein GF328_11820, partial [Candidatus Latescibacteria bacterium]|nr:hypothetical protein [Candidatus Latescibacterota bacterium]
MTLLQLAKRTLFVTAALLIAVAPVKAEHAFSGNILFDNLPDNCRPDDTSPIDACDLLRDLFLYNDEVDPQLGDPYNADAPDFIPAMTSPALGSNDDVVVPYIYERECDDISCPEVPSWAVIEPVCYRGAFAPAEDPWNEGNWLEGWTYTNFDGDGRTDIDYNKPLVVPDTAITGVEMWTNDNNYLLRGQVIVNDGAELTIEEGTVIFGERATVGVLIIARGGKLYARGTADAPIIMTSDQAPGIMAPGDFGGIVINGRAIANCADCLGGESCVSEGVPNIIHCGDDDCDDSGVLQYVRVEYAGHEIAPANELNAFTMNSLGNG